MTEERAREILGKWIRPDKVLDSQEPYAYIIFDRGYAQLDGDFTADQLEAIAFWMRRGK